MESGLSSIESVSRACSWCKVIDTTSLSICMLQPWYGSELYAVYCMFVLAGGLSCPVLRGYGSRHYERELALVKHGNGAATLLSSG